MFIHNLNFSGWLNTAKLSWASSRVRCLNSQYTNVLRIISVPFTWKTEYYMGCHSTSYIYLAEPLSHSCSGAKWGWWVESSTQPAWSSILINILVTGYQAQINMKSRSCFKVTSVQSHLSCFLYKVVHISWCSVQYLVTDEVSAISLSRCYVLPLHIIQVHPAVCVSCVFWHHLSRSSALSDMWQRMTSEVLSPWWREQRWFLKGWFTCYWNTWSGCWPKKVLLMYIFQCWRIGNYVHLWGCHVQKSYSSSGIDIWTDTCKNGHVNRLVKTVCVIMMGRKWRKFIK